MGAYIRGLPRSLGESVSIGQDLVSRSRSGGKVHKGRLEIYGRLLVSCASPTIQIDLLRKAGCHRRDVRFIEDLVRKGCLEKNRVGEGGWSRLRYGLTERGRSYAEHFDTVLKLLDRYQELQ